MLALNLDQDGNPTHEGVAYALEFFDRWIRRAYQGEAGVPLVKHMSRLCVDGTTPMDLLVNCAALYLYSDYRPDRIRDRRHLTYCIGKGVLRFKPTPAKIKPSEIREAGEIVLKALGVLLANISKAAQERSTKKRETVRAQSAPLET